ncbi:MAG: hypothetical protein CMJ84_12345, partial [Planctomycetes bacterium]|nr:hypothetical protein [Planctomycetota bacterium]
MTSAQPLTDLVLWLRFVFGSAVVLWLPGFLLAGRHLRNRPLPARIVLSSGIGMFLLALFAQFTSFFATGVRPVQFLPVAVLAAAWLGSTEMGRGLATGLDADEPSEPWLSPALVVAFAIGLACLIVGFGDFVVPPTTHDAANHAFMTLRISETGTVLASAVFGPPHGVPDLPYAMGTHASASMIAQVSGLAPYVSVWFMGLVAASLLPVSLSILWSEWRVPAAAVALGGLFVAVNAFVPSRMLWWGLFATAVGLVLVPVLALLLERFWSSASVEAGVVAGLATGSLMLIHGSEVPTAGLAALATIALKRSPPSLNLWGWAAFFATAIASGWYFLARVVPAYLSGGIGSGQEYVESLATAILRTLQATGESPLLQGLALFSLAIGLIVRRTRVLALATLSIALVITLLAVFRDPISGLITTPYYRQPERVRYLLVFFVPPLMGCGLMWGWERVRAETWPALVRWGVLVAGILVLVAPDLPGIVQGYEDKDGFAPFSRDDFRHAQQIATIVGPDEWIVNPFFDGSSWAMHVSGRRFLVPTGWRLTDERGRGNQRLVRLFAQDLEIDRLDEHFHYVYVSDLRTGPAQGFKRPRLDRDERFEAVAVGEHSTLYRAIRS